MPTTEILKELLQQASASGSRSTALQPLAWLSAILTSGLILAGINNAPDWSIKLLAILLGLTIGLYLIAYIFFAIKDPDALRSEKYTLSKLAIEKNLIGDDKSGLIELGEDNFSISTHTPSSVLEEKK